MGRATAFALTGGVVVAAGVAAILAAVRLAPQGQGRRPTAEEVQKEPSTRRLPVAGQPGSHVVILPDGTSYLEGPSGDRKPLVDDDFLASQQGGGPTGRILSAIRKRKDGQLLVLDRGVVEVPQGAQITLMTRDMAVVLEDDGSATAYHVDGRVERRKRARDLNAKDGR